jgi:hypothetical protein
VLIAVLLIVPGLIELTGHDVGRLTPQNHPPAVSGPIMGRLRLDGVAGEEHFLRDPGVRQVRGEHRQQAKLGSG